MQSILSYIGTGQANAVTRHELQLVTGLPDRALREAIAYEVAKGTPIVNKQDGAGYYISTNADEIDRTARQEKSRAVSSFIRYRALQKSAKKIRREENQCQMM